MSQDQAQQQAHPALVQVEPTLKWLVQVLNDHAKHVGNTVGAAAGEAFLNRGQASIRQLEVTLVGLANPPAPSEAGGPPGATSIEAPAVKRKSRKPKQQPLPMPSAPSA